MSLTDLCNTSLQILQASTTTDAYGSARVTYNVIQNNVNGRVIYVSGLEDVNNGKEIVTPDHKIFIDVILDINEKYLIIDNSTGNMFDVLFFDILGQFDSYHHLEIIAKKIDDYNLT